MMESPATRIRWCYGNRREGGAIEVGDETRKADKPDDDALVCARCETPVTSEGDRIRVRDEHEHYFVNPNGYDFHIGCFAAAPGCISAGRASNEWTWFSGYSWQLDHCRGCTRHLGWIFRSSSHVFHGLIVNRLLARRA